MKSTIWMGCFLALTMTLTVGCGGGSEAVDDTADELTVPETEIPTEPESETSSEPANEDGANASAPSGDETAASSTASDSGSVDGANADVASSDGDAIEATPSLDLDALDTAEEVELSLNDYRIQINRALGQGNLERATELTEAALKAFADNGELKLTYLWVKMQKGSQLEQEDVAAAAQNFLETGALAREMLDGEQELPEAFKRIAAVALFNEARGHAQGEAIDAATKAVSRAVELGLSELPDLSEDKFFAAIQNRPEFVTALENLRAKIAERMLEEARSEIAQTEAFDFDFELPDLEANQVKLADFRGKVVIVDIWGTWCPPCRDEVPHFIELQDAYANDLAIVGINYENGEPDAVIQQIKDFATQQGINYTCVIGDDATKDQVPEFRGFPTTLFLDRTGRVRLKVVGYHPYAKLDAYVKCLLEEGEPADAS